MNKFKIARYLFSTVSSLGRRVLLVVPRDIRDTLKGAIAACFSYFDVLKRHSQF